MYRIVMLLLLLQKSYFIHYFNKTTAVPRWSTFMALKSVCQSMCGTIEVTHSIGCIQFQKLTALLN